MMTEIDLIPQDYRTRRWQTRGLKVFGGVMLSLMFLHGAAWFAFAHKVKTAQQQIAELQSKQLITSQQRDELEALGTKRNEFERQLGLLNGLRSGGAAEQMFVTVERALTSDDVWFVDWRFQRSGVVVDDERAAVNTGYFIVVPADPNAAQAKPWQVQTHMTIRGQSRDHSALSAFVKGLFAQPEIEDVHVGRTSQSRVAAVNVVDFDLAVVMNTDVQAN
jgi:cell division protein FtsB